MPNYDHFLAVLGVGRWLERSEAEKDVRHRFLMVYAINFFRLKELSHVLP